MSSTSKQERSIARAIVPSLLAIALGFTAIPAVAAPFFFSTGDPDGKMATASRPDAGGKFEIESADDFVLTDPTSITHATFTGLLGPTTPAGPIPTVGNIVVEIYRVFPQDSDVTRTSGPPTFSTSQVPTRVNSPSDVALMPATRDGSVPGDLSFTANVKSAGFSTLNSIQPGGIHALPGIFTGGDGSLTGEEVEFDVDFTKALLLDAGHYFFVPQVQVTGGDFFWLSTPKPIVAPGTPFPPGFTDLQSWTRDAFLDPDWLRVGTDITHQGPFNAAFSLNGATIPEPATFALLGLAFAGMGLSKRRKMS